MGQEGRWARTHPARVLVHTHVLMPALTPQVHLHRPMVITGAAAASTLPPKEDWTPAHMAKHYGDYHVKAHLSPSGSYYTTKQLDGATWAVRFASMPRARPRSAAARTDTQTRRRTSAHVHMPKCTPPHAAKGTLL